MKALIISSFLIPILAGIILLLQLCFSHRKKEDSLSEPLSFIHGFTGLFLFSDTILTLICAWIPVETKELFLFSPVKDLPIYFHIDFLGSFFVSFISIVWLFVGFYAFGYMKEEGKEQRFFGFYLIVYGVMIALCFSGNLITFYFFFELMTVTSLPLVLHKETHEAIMASLKYLFYSLFGAYFALFAIFILFKHCGSLNFTDGGYLFASEHTPIILLAAFFSILGFGVKAGMFPMHGWLPTAHPIAPSPASAVLSATIVKAGVLGIIRVLYFIIGADYLMGTWVQYAFASLSLITVFMGSLLAYKESVFKKRLAYSTVSQVSYILFGLSMMNPTAYMGALFHSMFHAIIKAALFLSAGSFIFTTGLHNANDYRAIGKPMKKTLWAYTAASLALIGIPPFSGFISKWYLAQGALSSNIKGFGIAGVIVLLISALLTAGYLLPISLNGFLPGKDFSSAPCEKETPSVMWIPLALLSLLTLILGLFPGPIIAVFPSLLR